VFGPSDLNHWNVKQYLTTLRVNIGSLEHISIVIGRMVSNETAEQFMDKVYLTLNIAQYKLQYRGAKTRLKTLIVTMPSCKESKDMLAK